MEFFSGNKFTRANTVLTAILIFQLAGVPDFAPQFRRGLRVTVSGEVPYFDPNSGTQAQAWEAEANAIIAKQEAAEKAKAEALGKSSATTA